MKPSTGLTVAAVGERGRTGEVASEECDVVSVNKTPVGASRASHGRLQVK
jgi:hypothetical protein